VLQILKKLASVFFMRFNFHAMAMLQILKPLTIIDVVIPSRS
jgi:hypothetical protein